eukprot:PhM_4_TR17024/c0_g1_i1/m.29873/K07195/EXOC7, EXO70; exocyst complex component 7
MSDGSVSAISSSIATSLTQVRSSLTVLSNNVSSLSEATAAHRVAITNVTATIELAQQLKQHSNFLFQLHSTWTAGDEKSKTGKDVANDSLLECIRQALEARKFVTSLRLVDTPLGAKMVEQADDVIQCVLSIVEKRVVHSIWRCLKKVNDAESLKSSLAALRPKQPKESARRNLILSDTYEAEVREVSPLVGQLHALGRYDCFADCSKVILGHVLYPIDVSAKFVNRHTALTSIDERTYKQGTHMMLEVYRVMQYAVDDAAELCSAAFLVPTSIMCSEAARVFATVQSAAVKQVSTYTKISLSQALQRLGVNDRLSLGLDLLSALATKHIDRYSSLQSLLRDFTLASVDEAVHKIKTNNIPMTKTATLHENTTRAMQFVSQIMRTHQEGIARLLGPSSPAGTDAPLFKFASLFINALVNSLHSQAESCAQKDIAYIFLCNNHHFIYNILSTEKAMQTEKRQLLVDEAKLRLDNSIGHYLEHSWIPVAGFMSFEGLDSGPAVMPKTSQLSTQQRSDVKARFTKFFHAVNTVFSNERGLHIVDAELGKYVRGLAAKITTEKFEAFANFYEGRFAFKHPEKYLKCTPVELGVRIQTELFTA